jgi:hypothetical protein
VDLSIGTEVEAHDQPVVVDSLGIDSVRA